MAQYRVSVGGYATPYVPTSNLFSGTAARFLIQKISAAQDVLGAITNRWRDILVFTNWDSITEHAKILFLRIEDETLDDIMSIYLRTLNIHDINDPFWCYLAIIDQYLALQHKATYAIRDLTIYQERHVEAADHLGHEQLKIDYGRLHEIARHALTVHEILKVNIVTLEHIVDYHKSLMISHTTTGQIDASVRHLRRTHQRLLFYSHMFRSISERAVSYVDRMRNQIALTFNLVAQNEAHTSIEIARATKADSQAMKLTSLVALVFLPAMFVSAVFSTTFFDFDSDRGIWAMSDQFYVYWAFVVPVEAMSIALWYLMVYKKYEILARTKDLRQKHLRSKLMDVELSGQRF